MSYPRLPSFKRGTGWSSVLSSSQRAGVQASSDTTKASRGISDRKFFKPTATSALWGTGFGSHHTNAPRPAPGGQLLSLLPYASCDWITSRTNNASWYPSHTNVVSTHKGADSYTVRAQLGRKRVPVFFSSLFELQV